MQDLPVTPQLASIFSTLIEDKSGLTFSGQSSASFIDKVSSRAIESGFDSLLDYYYFLRYDGASKHELDILIDSVAINETYFFREIDQLQTLVSWFIAPKVARGERVRVWSAACSTGEEPLTLAMLLAEKGLLGQVSITASDISHKALACARKGTYKARSLRRNVMPDYAVPWLQNDDGVWQVAAALREHITWVQLNLTHKTAIMEQGLFDLVICRNVLIYFRDDLVRSILQTLKNVLLPQGVLTVGVSESLLRFGPILTCEEHNGLFVYRKPV